MSTSTEGMFTNKSVAEAAFDHQNSIGIIPFCQLTSISLFCRDVNIFKGGSFLIQVNGSHVFAGLLD
ncbi:MAG: hypothetical protein R3B47_15370 [Bacteroidia bacterium]